MAQVVPDLFPCAGRDLGRDYIPPHPKSGVPAPSQKEEGSGNIAIPMLSRCPECGHHQADRSVV